MLLLFLFTRLLLAIFVFSFLAVIVVVVAAAVVHQAAVVDLFPGLLRFSGRSGLENMFKMYTKK